MHDGQCYRRSPCGCILARRMNRPMTDATPAGSMLLVKSHANTSCTCNEQKNSGYTAGNFQ
jgi:hypothetical protein